MRVVVIGGTGHIGCFLTPLLAGAGHEVVVITSGRTPVPQTPDWKSVRMVKALYQRDDAGWKGVLAGLKAEVVIDIIGEDLVGLYHATKKDCRHLIACGSVWMFGDPRTVPTPPETQGPCRFDGYTQRYAEILQVKKQAAADGTAFTAIMPPNICGPGKIPLDTMGDRDIKIHRALSRGEEVVLPSPGSVLIGPCDAEDIARAFALAAARRDSAGGEIFNVGSAYALTAKRLAEAFGKIYGVNIPVRWVDWQEYITKVSPDLGCHYHFMVNMCPDIQKTAARLGYEPKYTPEQTMARGVNWMRENRLL
jgi:nucleoside-diphosphate-sugar epimerase